MEDCIFCKIIKGELPSKVVYEDDISLTIMNINPTTNGHLLIIPKLHQVNINDIDENFISNSFKITKEILYPLLKEKLGCEGLTISENNFLGQEIRHFHFHLTPRYKNDLVDFTYNSDLLVSVDDIYTKLTK